MCDIWGRNEESRRQFSVVCYNYGQLSFYCKKKKSQHLTLVFTVYLFSSDVSSTALHTLPHRGLGHLKVLIARSTPYLKTLPPLESLLELEVAEVTYPSHCCAFHTWRREHR